MEHKTKNICRTCLTEEATFQSVFQAEYNSGSSLHISEMLSVCATIQVNKGDGLPEIICTECANETAKMYLFKLKCEINDTILRERLKKVSLCYNENSINENQIETLAPKIKVEPDKDEKISENTEKEFKCNICLTKFSSHDLLTDHTEFHAIKMDELEIKDEDFQIIHNSVISPVIKIIKNVFPCSECNFVFDKKDDLEYHSSFHIKNQSKVSCSEDGNFDLETKPPVFDICFQDERPLVHPTSSSSFTIPDFPKENSHNCDICGKKYKQSGRLARHKRIHDGEKPHSCDICQKKFWQLNHLKSHNKTHTGTKPYECDICKKKLSTSYILTRHKVIHTGEKPYECDVCKKRYSQSPCLQIHKTTHTGKTLHDCNICKKKIATLQELLRHKRTHTGEKPFKCGLCKKRYNCSSSLTNHKKIHEKQFECDVCTRKFKTLKLLSMHERVHTGEKPYECDVCEKKYIYPSSLMCHKITHTGEKPYECDVCEKKYIYPSSLMCHKITHTGEKPYECGSCGKTFSNISNLARHKKNLHGIKRAMRKNL